MSLNGILSSATSGLLTNQAALKVTSNNITNTPGAQWRVQALDESLQAVGESAWLAFAAK